MVCQHSAQSRGHPAESELSWNDQRTEDEALWSPERPPTGHILTILWQRLFNVILFSVVVGVILSSLVFWFARSGGLEEEEVVYCTHLYMAQIRAVKTWQRRVWTNINMSQKEMQDDQFSWMCYQEQWLKFSHFTATSVTNTPICNICEAKHSKLIMAVVNQKWIVTWHNMICRAVRALWSASASCLSSDWVQLPCVILRVSQSDCLWNLLETHWLPQNLLLLKEKWNF